MQSTGYRHHPTSDRRHGTESGGHATSRRVSPVPTLSRRSACVHRSNALHRLTATTRVSHVGDALGRVPLMQTDEKDPLCPVRAYVSTSTIAKSPRPSHAPKGEMSIREELIREGHTDAPISTYYI